MASDTQRPTPDHTDLGRPAPTVPRAELPETADRSAVSSGAWRLDLSGGAAADDGPRPRPLPSVPGFEITREVARGGMGVVYEARQLRLNRTVALKMILAGGHADRDARARFRAEAEAVAALRHPDVIQVYEFGEHDGLPYFALEYVEGGSLAARVRRDGLPTPTDAAALAARLAGAVAAAHARGIIHRDLKPDNVLLTAAGEPKVADFGLARIGASQATQPGMVMGSPPYMSPEQAAGRTAEVGTRSDVYSLGAILYELLTGRPPFKGGSVIDTIQQVLTREPARPRATHPRVPRDLETICLKCLEKDPDRRYPTADALAADLRAFLAGRPIAARPVGPAERAVKWARRHPGRAAAVAAAVLVAAGAVVAADRVDEWNRLKQRETRAHSLVQNLTDAAPEAVPKVLGDLADVRDVARPRLQDLAAGPIAGKGGLHARLALLGEEPHRAAELAEYLPDCRPEELLLIRGQLAPHAGAVVGVLWPVLTDGAAPPGRRIRAACALAGLATDDPRWAAVAAVVADLAVRASPGEFVVWAEALAPVRGAILPELVAQYPRLRHRVESSRTLSDVVAEAAALDLTAELAARYAADRPAELAELAVTAEGRHYPLLDRALRENSAAVVPLLLAARGGAGLEEFDAPRAAAVGVAAERGSPPPDPVLAARAKRRAYAAAALLRLDHLTEVWPLLQPGPDPTVRSYLVERLPGVGVAPRALVRRFREEPDVSARRAIVVVLGEFKDSPEWGAADRAGLMPELIALYRDDPDPGLHSAIDWLLRQRWGAAAEVAAVDAQLAAAARAERPAAAVVGAAVQQPGWERRDWFVNREGQTFAVVRPPRWSGAFTMGSPPAEPGRSQDDSEPAHDKEIPRHYAIATREVTAREFRQFRRHTFDSKYSPDEDTPVIAVSWYLAAEYCNWLSRREGLPPGQWCYEEDPDAPFESRFRARPGFLSLAGYRLPTEAEWEYACRASSAVARYYGRADELLPRYAWSGSNADNRTHPVGLLRPNDLGLFDAIGNVAEWVNDPAVPYRRAQRVDAEHREPRDPKAPPKRILRGGGFTQPAALQRSAFRLADWPTSTHNLYGFRVARTLPSGTSAGR